MIRTFFLAFAALTVAVPASWAADEDAAPLTGREIMQLVDERDDGDKSTQDMQMILIDKGGEFYHGYTYSGHPASCTVAIANIDIMRREDLVARVRDDIGPYFQQRWATLGEHPLVGETRMVGMMGALEIVRDRSSLERFDEDDGVGMTCRNFLVENGLVVRRFIFG